MALRGRLPAASQHRPGAGMGPGASAASELREILEQYCGQLMALVVSWGGDVVRCAPPPTHSQKKTLACQHAGWLTSFT